MPNWTPEQYRDYEAKTRRSLQSSQPEQAVRHELHGPISGEEKGPPGIVVSIKCCRQNLLDPDNLCPKSLIDGLRYAGLIPNDRPQDIALNITQEKCSKQEERTEIEITLPD